MYVRMYAYVCCGILMFVKSKQFQPTALVLSIVSELFCRITFQSNSSDTSLTGVETLIVHRGSKYQDNT